MIVTKIQAGLGNQMFQYAVGLSLAARHNTELVLDISSYENMHENDTPRSYELDVFTIRGRIAEPEDYAIIKSPDYQRTLQDKIKHRLALGNAVYYYGETASSYDPRVLLLKNNTYLSGWWQSEKYFTDVRDQVLQDFTPKNKLSANVSKLIQDASNTNSVAVHVRRGDYVSNKFAAAHHGTATVDYYNASALFFKSFMPDAHFYVFSDDIDWCKKHLNFGAKTTYVSGNNGKDAYLDMLIMKSCKHNIIANSSFSWWGAWLNENESKIIIAPRAWYADPVKNREADIVPNNLMMI
jgi:hypothetical protein